MKKRLVFSALLCSCLLLGLAGCGGSKDDSSSKANTSNVGVAPNEGYKDPLTVSMVINDPFGKVKIPYSDTVWGKAFKKDLNINLEVKAAIPAATYDQRLNTLVASDDLPDIFSCSPAMYQRLTEDDMLEDISDVYSKYASKRLRTITEGNDKKGLNGSKVDGKLYGVPMVGDGRSNSYMVMVRQDWLDKLHLETPKTIDDVWKVAKAFKDNKMGGENTIGIPMDKELSQLDAIASAYGAHKGVYEYNRKTKKIEYSSTQPEMKKALSEIQDKFKEGLIDPEFITKDSTKVSEELKAGKAGIWFDSTMANVMVLDPLFADKSSTATFVAAPIRKSDGAVATQSMKTGAGNYFVVKKGAKNPEALLKLLDYTLYKWDSLKTYDQIQLYNYNNIPSQNSVNGFPIGALPDVTLRWPDIREKYEATGKFDDYVSTEDRIANTDVEKIKKQDPRQNKMWSWNSSQTGPGKALQAYADGNHYVYNYNQNFGSQTLSVKGSILEKIETDNMMNIITGNKSIDKFDTFVKEWDKNGGTKVDQELTKWANSQKGLIN